MESTTLNALRTLLHHPQLALKVDDAGTLARQDTYAQLLVSLLEALQKNSAAELMQLIARWHSRDAPGPPAAGPGREEKG